MATLNGTPGNDSLPGTATADSLSGLAGNDTLDGLAGNDTLVGGDGDDTLLGGADNDSLLGGNGADFIQPGTGSDLVDGGLITDRVNFTDGNSVSYVDFVAGGVTIDLTGQVLNADGTTTSGFTIKPGGTDTLRNLFNFVGSHQNDQILGSTIAMFELFQGLNGDDTIDGGAIDAVFLPGNSNRVSYTGASDAVQVDLLAGTATGAAGNDLLININQVRGSNFNDTLLGSDDAVRAEQFDGRGGNDSIDGRGGYDIVRYELAGAGLVVDLAGGTAADGQGGIDTLVGIEGAFGGNGNDVLKGDAGANRLEGRNGNDTLAGGLGDDTLDGGSGVDWVDYSAAGGPITAHLGTQLVSGADGNDTLVAVNAVRGSDFDDSITGSTVLTALDSFEGGDGNDTIDGAPVTDRGNYRNANWVFYRNSPAAVNVNLSGITGDGSGGSGTAEDGWGGTDTLRNTDRVLGSAHDDTITGSTARIFELFEGSGGDDTIDGGLITDLTDGRNGNRASYPNAPGPVTVDLVAGSATGEGNDVLLHISQVTGSTFADTLLGSDVTDYSEQFRGGPGNDSIDGRGGQDWVRYDDGSPLQGVSITLPAVAGTTFTVTDTFGATDTLKNIEHLRGSALADSLTGSGRTDLVERFMGEAGNDTIDGLGGNDIVYYFDAPSGVNVTIGATGSAADGYGNTDTLRNIEQVRGSTFADTLTGSDILAVTETFDGRQGNDTIDGRGGPDLADYFYAWNAGAAVNLATGSAADGFGSTDTLLNIEHVRGANDFGDTLVGNGAANSLDGAGGNDTLIGGAGSDALIGGTGTDSLVGGAGNDVYAVDATTDVVVEAAGEGQDSIELALAAAATYPMPAQVEGLTVMTSAAVNVTGNALPNRISGGIGNNSLVGGEGDDTISGGLGNDTIDGGIGNDRLRVDGQLSDFAIIENSPTELKITGPLGVVLTVRNTVEVVDFVFDFSTTSKTFTELLALAGGSGADSLTGTEGPDLLDGAGGNDTLVGLGGNDTLIGGAGTDSLVGGAGDDLLGVDAAADIVVEAPGGGTDTVLVNFAAAGTWSLAALPEVENATVVAPTPVAVNLTGNERDNLLVGNGAANNLTGAGGNDTLDGGAGNDTLAGGAGDDVYVLSAPTDVVNETAPGSAGLDLALLAFTANGSYTLPAGVENASVSAGPAIAVNVTGTTGDNTLVGNAAPNSLSGLAGHDTLQGGGGADTLLGAEGDDLLVPGTGSDSVVGGSGLNAISYEGEGAIDANLATGLVFVGADTDTVSGIGKLVAGIGNDTVVGGANDEGLAGNGGNDWLRGQGGNDTLAGGAGDDTLDGGAENPLALLPADWVLYDDGPDAVNVNLDTGVATGRGTDLLASIEGVRGSGGNDTLTAGTVNRPDQAFDYLLEGGAGDDLITGGNRTWVGYSTGPVTVDLQTGLASSPTEGNDTLLGGIGGVFGSQGDDSLTGNGSSNVLIGNAGNDTLRGGEGDDEALVPGIGSDLVDGGNGSDWARFFFLGAPVFASLQAGAAISGADTDTLVSIENLGGTEFNDTLIGDDSANHIHAEAGNDVVLGLEGNDSIQADDGADTVDAGGGNDTVDGALGADNVEGGPGLDSLVGGDGNDTLSGGDDADIIHGNLGNDVEVGGAGRDSLFGQEGADLLDGGADGDQLRGDADNDTILGGDGNDFITGGTGNDSIVGGAGFDFADYFFSGTNGPVSVNLQTGAVSGAEGNDTVSGIEAVHGGNFADTLVGSAEGNRLEGHGGNDSLAGGAGSDTMLGGAGSDTLDGGAITDRINYTDLNQVQFTDATGPVNVNLSGITGDGSTGSGTASDGLGSTDTIANANFFVLGAGNDVFVGSQARIFEQVDGGLGDDTLDGGAIVDTLNNRDGNRVSYAGFTSPVVVDLAAGTATGAGGNDTLLNFGQVRGSQDGDTISGSDVTLYTELFDGRGGADVIDGRGGFDIARYDNSGAGPVTVDLVAGTANDGLGSTDTLAGIEGVYGGEQDDLLLGGNADAGTDRASTALLEIFRGAAGNDTIDGGQGFDRVDYTNSTSGVVVTLADTADGSASDGLGGTDVLRNLEGIRGSAFNDTLTGSDTAPLETFEGREGNDRMDGRGGEDLANYRNSPAAVSVNLATGAVAADGWGGNDTLAGIEHVRGSRDGNDTVTGSGVANRIETFGGNDSIAAGDGDDSIDAGTGADTVDGGLGVADTLKLVGAFADYSLARPNPTDLVLVNPGTGENITARGVELFSFSDGTKTLAELNSSSASTGNDTLIGDDGPNLIDGLAGNDSIEGRGGNDTLIGGIGNDTLKGGAGDDLYHIDALTLVTGDQVIELGGEGTDRVLISSTVGGTYSLPAEVEHAGVLSGPTVAVHLVGNALDNELVGNSAANSLTGAAGNDTLDGGAGTDTLIGGEGADVYVLNVPTDVVQETGANDQVDPITFEPLLDRVDLVFTAAAAYTLPANVERARIVGSLSGITVTGNALNNDLQGGAGNDTLDGGAGFDVLTGGAGNDRLVGGTDGDTANYFDVAGPITVNLVTGLATGADGNDTLVGIENVNGGAEADSLTGDGADNAINGAGGNDTIIGGEGADFIQGEDGLNLMDGGGGDDQIFVGFDGPDTVIGGAGNDLVGFDLATGPVLVDLGAQTVGGTRSDSISGIEGARGTSAGDTLIGSDADNVFLGGEGADSMAGGLGNDRVRFLLDNGGVVVDLVAGTAVTSTGTDTLSGFETVEGSFSADTLVGDGANNLLDGRGGNDSLVGDSGDDTLIGGTGTDTMVGGLGNDTYEVAVASDAVTENLGEGNDTVNLRSGGGFTYTLPEHVENGALLNLAGAVATSPLVGNALNNLLTGSDLADSLSGGDGEDTLRGGAGNDTLAGGAEPGGGIDFVDYRDAPGAVTVNLSTGQATGHGTDVLTGIEGVFGTGFNDSVVGSGPLTFFQLGAGNDTVTGNGAFDIVDYGDSLNPIVFVPGAAGAGTATGLGTDVYTGIEGLFGSNQNDLITGSSANEMLRGRRGDDTLDGGLGADRADYRQANGSVVVSLVSNSSSGADGNDTLISIEHLRGSLNFADTLTGNESANTLDGLGGDDVLVGNGGDDTMRGGAGNDTLDGGAQTFFDFADFGGSPNPVVVDLSTGIASGEGFDVLIGVEGVIGSAQNDSITGSAEPLNYFWPGAGDDTIDAGDGLDLLAYDNQDAPVTVLVSAPGTGTATGLGTDVFTGVEFFVGGRGNDSIVGSSADEAMRGMAGNDTLDGAGGIDRADYRRASGGVVVSLVTNTSSGPDGVDMLIGFENLRGSLDFGDTLTGDAGANDIDGLGGNDSIQGNAGNDTLLAGTGVDTLDGGADTDTAVMIGAQASYTMTRPNATDLVLVSAATQENVTLRNVETVQFSDGTVSVASLLSGAPSGFPDTLVGTDGAELIDGLAGNDSISGLGGNDTLVGGAGNDTLVGGPGDDLYRVDVVADVVTEASGEGRDRIEIGLALAGLYTLPAEVEEGVLVPRSSLTAIHITGNGLDNLLVGNDGANSLTGADGNDTLDGGTGNDTMIGGPGNDVFFVNVPADTVTETPTGGLDELRVRPATSALTFTMADNVERALVQANLLVVTVNGNAADNHVTGHDGNDSLAGNTGNDTLLGGDGLDTLAGGIGNDSLAGGGGNDSVNGGDGNDTIEAGQSTDTVDGGTGSDLLRLPGTASQWTITRPSATVTQFTGLGVAIVGGVESVQFGAAAPVALTELIARIGSPGADSLVGTPGMDTLSGGDGNDTLTGLGGDDLLDGGNGSDTYQFTAGSELEVIEQNDTVAASADVLAFGAGIAAADLHFVRGHFSYDDLVVRVGADGEFGQVVVVNFFNGELVSPGTIDQVRLASGQIVTQAQLAAAANAFDGGNHVFLGTIGNDALSGDRLGAADDWVFAGSGNDTVLGLSGNDTLFGGNGADSLAGGDFDDVLTGGDGADTIDGGAGSDVLSGGAGGDRYLFGLGSGEDLVTEAFDAAARGGALVSGVGPVYTLTDADLPRSADLDVLALGAGITPANLRVARDGNDLLLQVQASFDSVRIQGYFAPGVPTIERIQFATGQVWTQSTVQLMLIQPTPDNDTLIGYQGGDNLNGQAGDDLIDGRDGPDLVFGGPGSDTLTGGAGADRFVFGAGALDTPDLITDFQPGIDRIWLKSGTFTALVGSEGTSLDPDASPFLDYDPVTGELSYDADAGGASPPVVVALLGQATHPAELGLDITVTP